MNVTMVDWAVLLGLVLFLLAADLLAATLRPHAVGLAEAALWSVFFVAVAAGFGVVLGALEGWGYAGQFFAGYVVEKSLSVDNLFVFAVIMSSFAVPREHQQRVLIFGIAASLCLRAVFIAAGAALLSALSVTFLVFGLALIWTAVRLLTHRRARAATRTMRRAAAGRRRPAAAAGHRRLPRRTADHPELGRRRAVTRCSSCSPSSAAPTCCSPSTRSRPCSASPARPTSCSPPTRSPCSACAPCTSSSPPCSTGWSTCRSGSRSSSPSSGSS